MDGIDILCGEHGSVDERHALVGEQQLHIDPGADAGDLSIFLDHVAAVGAGAAKGVALGHVGVAGIDDVVEVAGLQVAAGAVGRGHV